MKKQEAELKDFDFEKSEPTIKNITIPNSRFGGHWSKQYGYSIGYEGIQITRSFPTLEEALNQIGYGVDEKEDGDELVKVTDVNYEVIANMVLAMLIIREQNDEKDN